METVAIAIIPSQQGVAKLIRNPVRPAWLQNRGLSWRIAGSRAGTGTVGIALFPRTKTHPYSIEDNKSNAAAGRLCPVNLGSAAPGTT